MDGELTSCTRATRRRVSERAPVQLQLKENSAITVSDEGKATSWISHFRLHAVSVVNDNRSGETASSNLWHENDAVAGFRVIEHWQAECIFVNVTF